MRKFKLVLVEKNGRWYKVPKYRVAFKDKWFHLWRYVRRLGSKKLSPIEYDNKNAALAYIELETKRLKELNNSKLKKRSDEIISGRPSEKIVCSAIWYKDLPTQEAHSCKNVDKGIVLFGLRHAHIISICKTITGLRTVTTAPDAVGDFEQGFLTTENRFVSRQEAWIIAKIEKQIINVSGGEGTLYSEDIY